MDRPHLTKATIAALVVLLLVQLVSGLFFASKLFSDVFSFRIPIIPWHIAEVLEILASVGVLSGAATSFVLIRFSLRRVQRVEAQLSAAATGVQKHVEAQFERWGLTDTERDVALLVVKGFSNAEISSYRGTTESTTKSQVSSVFRKSGLKSRQQLVSLVIEDFFTEFEL